MEIKCIIHLPAYQATRDFAEDLVKVLGDLLRLMGVDCLFLITEDEHAHAD